MTTSFLEQIKDLPETSVQDFALICAVAFFRDCSTLPAEFAVVDDAGHRLRIEEAEKEAKHWESMSDLDAEAESAAATAKVRMGAAVVIADRSKQRAGFSAIYTRVIAWKPPSAASSNLRSYMLQQLAIGLEENAVDSLSWPLQYLNEPTESGPEFRRLMLLSAKRDVEIRKESYAKEAERVARQNAFLKELRDPMTFAVAEGRNS